MKHLNGLQRKYVLAFNFSWAGAEAIGLQSLTSSRHTRTRSWVSWSVCYMPNLVYFSVPKGSENMAFVDVSEMFKIFWYTTQETRPSTSMWFSSWAQGLFRAWDHHFDFCNSIPRAKVCLRDQHLILVGKHLAQSPRVSFLNLGTSWNRSQAIPDVKIGDVSRDGSVFGSAGSLQFDLDSVKHMEDIQHIQHIQQPKLPKAYSASWSTWFGTKTFSTWVQTFFFAWGRP